jgi:hypothetical protein
MRRRPIRRLIDWLRSRPDPTPDPDTGTGSIGIIQVLLGVCYIFIWLFGG